MPHRLDDIQKYGVPISFLDKGKVSVRVAPSTARNWKEKKIPLDGRHYCCAGTIILKKGLKLRANFEIRTHTFDFLDRETVFVYIENDRAWYSMDEPELYDMLKITKEQAIPYKWIPDTPLDYHDKGPYAMKWSNDET